MISDSPSLVYWDACIFIDGLRKTQGRFTDIQNIENQARSEEIKIVTSAFTIAEVIKSGASKQLTINETRAVKAYWRHGFITIRQVDRPIGEKAAELSRAHKLKPADAVHVATALKNRCKVLYTYDTGLLALDEKIEGLPIKKPGEFGQGILPLGS